MRADLAAAESKVAGARADLEKARQQLGDQGTDNAHVDGLAGYQGPFTMRRQQFFDPVESLFADQQAEERISVGLLRAMLNRFLLRQGWTMDSMHEG